MFMDWTTLVKSVLPNLRFNTIPMKMLASFLVPINKPILTFLWKVKGY